MVCFHVPARFFFVIVCCSTSGGLSRSRRPSCPTWNTEPGRSSSRSRWWRTCSRTGSRTKTRRSSRTPSISPSRWEKNEESENKWGGYGLFLKNHNGDMYHGDFIRESLTTEGFVRDRGIISPHDEGILGTVNGNQTKPEKAIPRRSCIVLCKGEQR